MRVVFVYTASRFGAAGTASTYFLARYLNLKCDLLVLEPNKGSLLGLPYERDEFSIISMEVDNKGSLLRESLRMKFCAWTQI